MRLLAAAVIACAAMPITAQQPEFKSGVELIRIPVTLSQGDKPVEPGAVTAADFKVTEDGVPQEVLFFQRERVPLSLGVVLDASSSMSEGVKLVRATTAVRELFALLFPRDEIAVVTFAERPRLVVPWTWAADTAAAELKVVVGGQTSLQDALRFALGIVDTARNARHAVLLISDGFENASRASLRDVVATRRQSEVQVSAFRIASPAPGDLMNRTKVPETVRPRLRSTSPMLNPVNVLPSLIGDSGGELYSTGTTQEVVDAARAFVEDLRLQYTLGYAAAKSPDGTYRTVKVEVNKPGVSVRHRGGYLALPGKD